MHDAGCVLGVPVFGCGWSGRIGVADKRWYDEVVRKGLGCILLLHIVQETEELKEAS